MGLVECVPNFSEGRRPEILDAIVRAMTAVPGVACLDREMDSDHNRAVVTIAGEGDAVCEAAFRGTAKAAELIDLRTHKGEHPRMGATDVVPFIPLAGSTMDDCVALARRLGERIGRDLRIPVFCYEAAATRPERQNLADVRKGEFEGLRDEIGRTPERTPDYGPDRIHETAGATAVGARFFLVAFNVNLKSTDVKIAKAIAKLVRERDGGLPHVKALGFDLAERKLVQVSMNLTDYRVTSLRDAYLAVSRAARDRDLHIAESEIIGLVPEEALSAVGIASLKLARFAPDQVIEARLAKSRGLSELPLPEFLARLASETPTPGGGSAAALAGALAAALSAMVVRLTVGKKKYAEQAEQLAPLLPELDTLARDLRGAITRDAAAYDGVVEARRLPKEAGPARATAIAKATREAAAVPLECARLAARVAQLAPVVAAKGNPNAITDAGAAAALAEAAVEVAGWNVLVNAKDLPEAEAAPLRAEVERLRTTAHAAAQTTRDTVAKALA